MRISDWSSDVCSSDLADQCFGEAGIVIGEPGFEPVPVGTPRAFPQRGKKCAAALDDRARRGVAGIAVEQMIGAQQREGDGARALEIKIGRESCRERVCQYV